MMFELLKKKTRKSYVIRAIVSAVVMFAVLALTHFAIFDVISGPVKLDIEKDPDTYKGKYVTIAAEAVLVDYAGHIAAASSRDDGSDKSAGGYSYIAFQSVDDPENNTSIWLICIKCFSLIVQSQLSSSMESTTKKKIES